MGAALADRCQSLCRCPPGALLCFFAALEGLEDLDFLAAILAAEGETGAVGHDAVILPDLQDMFHVEENAAAGFQKQIRWNEKGGILKPDADAVTRGSGMEEDIVPVGYEIEKIMTGNGKRRAAK